MKTITHNTLTRIANTRTLVAQLPEVFTRNDYEALRQKQAEAIAHEHLSKCPYPDMASHPVVIKNVTTSMKREEAAFSFNGLREDGFLMVVHTEIITKEVDYWGCLEDENGNIIKGSYDCHKRTIEIEHKHYRIRENLEDFFAEMLDK